MTWNRSVPMAIVVGTPTTKMRMGIRIVPPPAPKRPAKSPARNPTPMGTSTDILGIPETGREMYKGILPRPGIPMKSGVSLSDCTRRASPAVDVAPLPEDGCLWTLQES